MNDISAVFDMLRKISYKPGWKIRILERAGDYDSFDVAVVYEGYESKNAAFDPICFESPQVGASRERLAISIGKTVRHNQPYCYSKSFSRWDIQNMPPEAIIRYVIGGTIKEAEQYEFERWFKFDGVPIFENGEKEQYERPLPQYMPWDRPQQMFYPAIPFDTINPLLTVTPSMVEFTQEMSIEEAKKRWPNTPIPGEKP
jgi:hypothetical protein